MIAMTKRARPDEENIDEAYARIGAGFAGAAQIGELAAAAHSEEIAAPPKKSKKGKKKRKTKNVKGKAKSKDKRKGKRKPKDKQDKKVKKVQKNDLDRVSLSSAGGGDTETIFTYESVMKVYKVHRYMMWGPYVGSICGVHMWGSHVGFTWGVHMWGSHVGFTCGCMCHDMSCMSCSPSPCAVTKPNSLSAVLRPS